jgi:hypothetical protein
MVKFIDYYLKELETEEPLMVLLLGMSIGSFISLCIVFVWVLFEYGVI